MIIAVDFDGTCVDHAYPAVGRDAPDAARVLSDLVMAGHQLILYTMRSGEHLDAAETWFKEKGIPLFGSNTNPEQHEWTASPKCYAQLYIDDAALGSPVAQFIGFNRPCVHWKTVEQILIQKKIL